MGSHSISFELPGDKTKDEVMAAFRARQQQESSENGHQQGYSGDFQTIRTIQFHDKTFDNGNDAYEYCLDNAEKYSHGVAVKYKKNDSTNWLVAGWAVS